jgi:hypothetical protein
LAAPSRVAEDRNSTSPTRWGGIPNWRPPFAVAEDGNNWSVGSSQVLAESVAEDRNGRVVLDVKKLT